MVTKQMLLSNHFEISLRMKEFLVREWFPYAVSTAKIIQKLGLHNFMDMKISKLCKFIFLSV